MLPCRPPGTRKRFTCEVCYCSCMMLYFSFVLPRNWTPKLNVFMILNDFDISRYVQNLSIVLTMLLFGRFFFFRCRFRAPNAFSQVHFGAMPLRRTGKSSWWSGRTVWTSSLIGKMCMCNFLYIIICVYKYCSWMGREMVDGQKDRQTER